MQTTVTEIADGIYRLSTFVEAANLRFNQFLIGADEPLIFHCGLQRLFPLVSEALSQVIPIQKVRWVSYGHFEADECGAMNHWLRAAPNATLSVGAVGCMVSAADIAIRAPKPLEDGELLDLGGKRVRYLYTPHVPHGWDAGLLYEETTRTLLCGDLFTRTGDCGAETEADLVGPAFEAEDTYKATVLSPLTAPTIRELADLSPTTLGLMHGPAFHGNGRDALLELADGYAQRFRSAAANP